MFTLKNITQDLTYSQDFTEFKRGVKISIPMLLGIIPFALVLGAQATQKAFLLLKCLYLPVSILQVVQNLPF